MGSALRLPDGRAELYPRAIQGRHRGRLRQMERSSAAEGIDLRIQPTERPQIKPHKIGVVLHRNLVKSKAALAERQLMSTALLHAALERYGNTMTVLRRIDDFLFDRVFQPLVNCFPFAGPGGVARVFLVASAAADVIMFASGPPFRPGQLEYAMGMKLALYFAVDLPPVELGVRNPKRIELFDFALRLFFLAFFTGGVVGLAFDYSLDYAAAVVSWLCFCSHLYARACDKLPPARSTVSWWASLFAGARA